jgi:hypothetical protein
MRQAQPKASHQSRPSRRFVRRLPAAAAVAALIAVAPGYAAANPLPSRPAVVAKQSAVTLNETTGGGTHGRRLDRSSRKGGTGEPGGATLGDTRVERGAGSVTAAVDGGAG